MIPPVSDAPRWRIRYAGSRSTLSHVTSSSPETRSLHGAILRFKPLKKVHLFEALLIWLIGDVKLRQRSVVKLQCERLAVEPERDVLP